MIALPTSPVAPTISVTFVITVYFTEIAFKGPKKCPMLGTNKHSPFLVLLARSLLFETF
jgi:hypothetical protein